MRFSYYRCALWAVCSVILAYPAVAQEDPPSDGTEASLGSTMTLEDIGIRPKSRKPKIGEDQDKVLEVVPQGEPAPALKYRFWRVPSELRPGSAQIHFGRALLMWQQVPNEYRQQILLDWNSVDVSEQQLTDWTNSLSQVYAEIRAMALAENDHNDLRLRQLEGTAVYEFLLPEYQAARDLARILSMKIRLQVARGNTAGAIESMRDGFRLAHFVGQGETLVQSLVGFAIESMMLEQARSLIQNADSPNLYWSLATLPRPLINFTKSVQFEVDVIDRVLPVLQQAESDETFDENYWNQQWTECMQDLVTLSNAQQDGLSVALAVLGASAVEPARKALIAAGEDPNKVQSMPAMKAVLRHTSFELKRLGDDFAKGAYLPGNLGYRSNLRFARKNNEWLKSNELSTPAATIGSLLFPAVEAVSRVGIRQEYLINQLMTAEALRMHAAVHGALPDSLDQLDPVPALQDPFSGASFRYEVTQDSNGSLVRLSGDVPASEEHRRVMQLRFKF